MEPNSSEAGRVVLTWNEGLDGEPLLLYEHMLLPKHLDDNGLLHDSVVSAQCLLVFEKHRKSLADLGIEVYLAPFDLFSSVIRVGAVDKHERLARKVYGDCIRKADVSFIPASANTHFSLSVVVRDTRRLVLMDSHPLSGHFKLIADRLVPFLTLALPEANSFPAPVPLAKLATQAVGSNVCGPNISLFLDDGLQQLVSSRGDVSAFTEKLLNLKYNGRDYAVHRKRASAALRALVETKNCTSAAIQSQPSDPPDLGAQTVGPPPTLNLTGGQSAPLPPLDDRLREVPGDNTQARGAESDCPFNIGDSVKDTCFDTGVVKRLCSSDPNYKGPGGQVFVEFDNKEYAPTWRTWTHLEPCSRKRPIGGNIRDLWGAASAEPARLNRPRLTDAKCNPEGEGKSQLNGFSGADSSSTPTLAGVHLSSIERDRVIKLKPPAPIFGHRQSGSGCTHETKVSIEKRLQEFPDQSLCNSLGKILCRACKKEVKNSAHLIKQHLNTQMHTEKLAKLLARNREDDLQKDLITEHFLKNPAEVLATVNADVQLFRFRTVEAFMGSGIEIAKIDELRGLLERGGNSLGGASHLRMYIPKVRDAEVLRIKEELRNEHIGLSFDATRRRGDAVNVTARFCSVDFRIIYRLVLFITAEKHLDGVNTARLLTQLLLTTMHVDIFRVVAFMRDSVPANGVAVRSLLGTFSSSVDILCVPHTLNHVGERFNFPTLDEFLTPFITLVCNDGAAKVLWKNLIGEPVVGFSVTRWYCKAEIAMQIGAHFDKLHLFLRTLVDNGIGDSTTSKMMRIYSEEKERLRLQLAALLDMRKLVLTTYELEGDRLELLLAGRRHGHHENSGSTDLDYCP
jgi:hypothetical protein